MIKHATRDNDVGAHPHAYARVITRAREAVPHSVLCVRVCVMCQVRIFRAKEQAEQVASQDGVSNARMQIVGKISVMHGF